MGGQAVDRRSLLRLNLTRYPILEGSKGTEDNQQKIVHRFGHNATVFITDGVPVRAVVAVVADQTGLQRSELRQRRRLLQ